MSASGPKSSRSQNNMLRVRLIDLFSGKNVWPLYQVYKKSQWYDREQLDQYRVAKLRRLIAHCERHIPFYRDHLRRERLSAADVDSLEVLKAFPVVDKTILRSEYARFISPPGTVRSSIRISRTGGTTGEPLQVPKDAQMRSSAAAARLRFYDWMGIRFGEPVLVLWGAPIVRQSWKKRLRATVLSWLANSRQVDVFGISPGAIRDLTRKLRRTRPVLLHGYCQSLYELARSLVDSGQQIPLRAVSTTVEPLFEQYRDVFRQAFSCDVFDEYGCGEVETIAMECASHGGRHVVEERVVLELDVNGDVIVTDLDNHSLPFIRYRNGDQAILAKSPCACGRVHLLLDRIVGRIGDVIAGPNGRRLHPEFFTHLLNETGIAERVGLRRYQVVQETPNKILWKIVCGPLESSERDRLIQGITAYLGPIEVTIQQVDDIPVARSGKFQYVIAPR